MNSFRIKCKKRKLNCSQAVVPDQKKLDSFLEEAVELLPSSRMPTFVREDGSIDEVFLRGVIPQLLQTQIRNQGSPGLPYTNARHTNKALVSSFLPLLVDLVVDRTKKLSSSRPLPESVGDRMVQNYQDPIHLFPKSEWHPLRKKGVWRLIFALSCVDCVVQRLLFSGDCNARKYTYKTIPAQSGMGLDDDSLVEFFESIARVSKFKGLVSCDVSGWDWSVQLFEQIWAFKLRMRLMNVPTESPFWWCCFHQLECMLKAPMVVSGRVYIHECPGIQPSGQFITTSSNSMMRWLAARCAGCVWAKTNGDDCISDDGGLSRDDLVARYQALGHSLREVIFADGDFSFCSQVFTYTETEMRLSIANPGKMLYNFFSQREITVLLVDALKYELRNETEVWLRVADFLSTHIRSGLIVMKPKELVRFDSYERQILKSVQNFTHKRLSL